MTDTSNRLSKCLFTVKTFSISYSTNHLSSTPTYYWLIRPVMQKVGKSWNANANANAGKVKILFYVQLGAEKPKLSGFFACIVGAKIKKIISIQVFEK